MSEADAIKLIAEYDAAVGDCELRPNSKAAGKRFQAVMQRLIDGLCADSLPHPIPEGTTK